MPANSRVFLKPFIGGLNTEGSDVDDMVLNTSDELNCTILPEQMRGRRYGFNIERDGKWIDTDVTNNISGSVYYWKNVAKTDLDILVCRIADKLYFFDAAVKPISDSEPLGSVSLKDYIIDDKQFYKEKFGFAVGDGKLTVVNRWMQPVRIIYNVDTNNEDEERFVVESFTLSIRDIEGVVDSWGVKSAQQLVDEGNDEPKKPLSNPSWTITDSAIAKLYLPYCDTSGGTDDCYLIRRRKGLDKQYKIGPLTKDTVGAETHVFWDDKDIGIYQTGNDIYGGSREHYYNLLNQGWSYDDLDKFSQAMTTAGKDFIWPDNSMAVTVGRDNTGAYNTGDVVYTYLGNTQQPRGHFILDYFNMNRSEVSGIWDFRNAATADYSYQNTWVHSRSLSGVMISNHSTTIEDSQGIISKVVLKWTKLYRKSAKKAWDLHWRGNIEIKIYGLSQGEWTLITTRDTYSTNGASSTTPFTHTIEIAGQTDVYDKYRVDVKYSNGNGTSDYPQPLGVTVKVAIFTKDNDSGDYFNKQGDSSRVTDVAYMSGKYFYLCKDSVLFSQTVREDGTGFDLCYQDADPTSTEVSDVVTTDGGYVKFNTMGRGVALKTFNRGVLVFGRDVVYGLISPLESRFTATDYDILELSRAGLISAESVVSTTQQVYYWSPTGIYTIGVNPETGSTIFAQSISINSIQTFYNNLPQFSKEHCKGVYDYTTNRIYWYYPTNADQLQNLDGCLVYDLTYNCFMPQNVSERDNYNTLDAAEVSQSYEIEPTYYLRAGGNRVVADGAKVLVSEETSTDYHRWTSVQHLILRKNNDNIYQFSIGDFNDREFRDWDHEQYTSYLVSRPITLGDTYFNKQTPVMQTLFRRTEEYPTTLLQYDDTVYNVSSSITSYCLKGSGEYPIDPNFGVLTKPNYSKTYIVGNDGYFKTCKFKINVNDFIERTAYLLTAYVKCGGTLIGYTSVRNKVIDGPYIELEVNVLEEYKNTNNTGIYELGVQYIDSENRSYVSSQKTVPFTAEFIQLRSNYRQNMFIGLKEETVKNSVLTTDSGPAWDRGIYLDPIQVPECFLKSASISITPDYTDATGTVSWSTVIELNGNQYNNYMSGNQGHDYPIGTASIMNQNSPICNSYYDTFADPISRLENTFTFKGANWSFRNATLMYVLVKYQLNILVPQYSDEKPVIKRITGYTTPSGAFIRMRWGWSVNPLSNRWDMIQNGYRPQKDFLHDDYVESRLHIRGRGKAFQVEIRNEDNKDFRLTGLNIITRSPQ